MNTTVKVGVVGQDISYSKSHDIFHAIGNIIGVDISCDIHSVTSDSLQPLLERVRSGDIDGLSVTIPYKATLMSMLDEVDAEAASIGAVNSICGRNGRLFGFNTDAAGFIDSLTGFEARVVDKRAMILGNGGAAAAVVYALYDRFAVKAFVVVGRDPHRLESFRDRLAGVCREAQFVLSDYSDVAATDRVDVVVNCTPVGGANDPGGNPQPVGLDMKKIGFYYDLNYNRPNRIVAMMQEHGVESMDGARMLVAQATLSYGLWKGEQVNPGAVYAAVFEAGARKEAGEL